MVKIDRETGTVTWDSYILYPRLFHDSFEQKYPHLTPIYDEYKQDEPHTRIYHLPTTNLDTSEVKLGITYYDSRLSGISIGVEYSDEINLWQRELLGWEKIAQKWLTAQLGQPHEIQPSELFDMEYLFIVEEIQLIREWRYRFRWGNAGFSYDGLGLKGGIYIHCDYHEQVMNWDELAVECEAFLQKQQQQNGNYISHLLATRSLIDMVRFHFDYQKVKPRIQGKGLAFRLYSGRPTVRVNIHPNEAEKRYEVSRDDSTRKVFIAAENHSQLIDILGVFLENEKL